MEGLSLSMGKYIVNLLTFVGGSKMIETYRLILEAFTLEMVKAAVKDQKELEKVLNMEVSEQWPNPQYAKILPMKIEELTQQPSLSKWTRLVVLKEENKVIGEIGCKGGPNETGIVEIGYGLVPNYRNQGFATEMVKGMVEWLFQKSEVNKVTAECLEENIPSARVLEKAGFQKVNHSNGMLYWEIEKQPS